jgi:hypothetical protein
MGNITFLRKRRGISRQLQSTNVLADIKNTYAEYFISVREALTKISKALSQIEANLNPGSGLEPKRAAREHRRNPYSRKPKLTIS